MTEPRKAGPTGLRSRRVLLLGLLAWLCVMLPFLGWQATWFGRRLTDAEIDRYLRDEGRPRKIQHALSQIADRILGGDGAVTRWYPRVVTLSHHPMVPIRNTAAWVMGQDNRSEVFHQALTPLLHDPDPMVRRNAALALVRFGDDAGRGELVATLRAFPIRAPAPGTVSMLVSAGHAVGAGTAVSRIQPDAGPPLEVRAPFPGEVAALDARDGQRVAAGASLLRLRADSSQVWEALRALYLVGRPEDLAEVERQAREPGAGRVREQAVLTARAIRSRGERNPTR